MIYVPSIENACYYFDNNSTIIKLPSNYQIGETYNAEHIAIDNHYQSYYKNVSVIDNVNCIDHNNLSDYWIYRSDISDIIIYFLFFMLFLIFVPYKLATRFWRWLS